ncbi:hypothetical protein JP75_20405 [Devosia riboflavina]|uniref:Uncharacterized protein n=1 Tax=Devosia riboflavina TaxID=46914 RepID=A0A087LY32_9HYPH|nr:hypothetical protein [Devosia riboflavina]KFL29535.1 hypothetical protein JP75_20405 [Devosia riboflavina]
MKKYTPIPADEVGHRAETDVRRRNSYFSRLRKFGEARFRPSGKSREGTRLHVTVDYIEALTSILLMIVSVGILLLTYAGVSMPLSESGEGLLGKAHALSFATIVAVLAWLGWKHIFSIVPRLRKRRMLTGILAGSIYALCITAIDAPFSVLALGGPTAVKLSMADTVESYEDITTAVAGQSSTAAQLVPVMTSQVARFASLADVEVATGAQSGSKGEGKVSETFRQVSTILGTLSTDIQGGMAQANKVQGEISTTLAEMKSYVFITGDIGERSRGVSIAADKIDRLLAQVRQYDYVLSIEATLSILENLVPDQGDASSDFEAVQNRELRVIAEMVKPVADSLRHALANLDGEAVAARPARPLDALEAIRAYWVALLPQWIASIFLDLSPLALLVIQLAGRREVEHLNNDHREGASK